MGDYNDKKTISYYLLRIVSNIIDCKRGCYLHSVRRKATDGQCADQSIDRCCSYRADNFEFFERFCFRKKAKIVTCFS